MIIGIVAFNIRHLVAAGVKLGGAQFFRHRAVGDPVKFGKPDIAVQGQFVNLKRPFLRRVAKRGIIKNCFRVVAENLQLDEAPNAVRANNLRHQDELFAAR